MAARNPSEARQRFMERFEREADPAAARRAYFAQLAAKSTKVRDRRKARKVEAVAQHLRRALSLTEALIEQGRAEQGLPARVSEPTALRAIAQLVKAGQR